MKLIALLIGLLIERIASQLFHLRDLRWLDRLIDSGFRGAAALRGVPALVPVIVLTFLFVLPVFLVIFLAGDRLSGYPYMVLAILVLFFSLGPRDIGEDIDEYCKSLESGDPEEIRKSAKALTERDPPSSEAEQIQFVEDAACVQANNRLFAVIFWFVLLGPFGAWAYRVSDLIRRRAAFNVARGGDSEMQERFLRAARLFHGWLAWLPARLTALGFALAGSFDGALRVWRTPAEDRDFRSSEQSELLLARVGSGALALERREGESDIERAVRGANAVKGLIVRLLIIWAAVIGAMTLYGWSL